MAATVSTGHRTKRPYQPPISSYFNRDAAESSNKPERARSPLSPPVPPETQASLLNVGMRVRKSVPEGYKTHKTLGTPGFPFPSTAPASSSPPTRSSHSDERTRELMPFCGLHKTGGWAQQEQSAVYVPPSSAPPILQSNDEDNEEDVPELDMSQRTIPSTLSSFTSSMTADGGASRKRTFEEEIEDDMDQFFDEMEAADAVAVERPVAKPKATLRRAATTGVAIGTGDGDFEEAPFLTPMDVDDGDA